jgi:hypothetical protein
LVPSINDAGAADATAGGCGTVAGAPGARSIAESSGSGVEHKVVNEYVLRLKAGAVNAADCGKTRHDRAIIQLRLFIVVSLAECYRRIYTVACVALSFYGI